MRRGHLIALAVPAILALAPLRVQAQAPARGAVTYVSGDVYYISLGSGSGASDSALAFVVDGKDTAATLKVFAVSSKSSACRIVSVKRPPKVGDVVLLRADARPDTAGLAETGRPDTSMAAAPPGTRDSLDQRIDPAPGGRRGGGPDGVPAVIVRGRISAQYQTYILDSSFATVTQPSLSVHVRGQATGVPLRFEVAGSIRSTVTGTSGPFASGAVNRNRIYRLSIEFDDSLNRVGVGRLFPSAGLPSAYIDGLVVSRRFGVLELGAAAGYEPDFRQQNFLSDRRKAMLFAVAASAAPFPWSASAGFSKSFLASANERSVLSGSAAVSPSRSFFFSGQTEIDFLAVKNSVVVSRPKLTSLVGHFSVRAADMLTVGAGMTAWRSVFPLSLASAIPDSMRDDRLTVSPSFSVRFHAAGGLSVQEQYSPRSTDDGFAKEYSNMFSIGMENIARSGVGMRATQTLNRSSFARSTGYGVSARRSIGAVADATLRYQHYRHDFERGSERLRTNAAGAEIGVALTRALYLMLGAELSFGSAGDHRLLNGSLSWRF